MVSLTEMNKLGKDARGRLHEFMIAIEDKVLNIYKVNNGNQQLLWIIGSIE